MSATNNINNRFFAGIDLGTSGCRLIVIDISRQIQHIETIKYSNAANQSPELWWNSVAELFAKLPQKVRSRLHTMSIDGTSGTILLLDKQGKPSSPAIMYNDLRATAQAQRIKNALPENNGGQGVFGSLARLLWLLDNYPDRQHQHALHQADYIVAKLTGDYRQSDENNALKLGYDVVNRVWPEALTRELNIPAQLLPKVVPAGTNIGVINSDRAQQLQLPEDLKIVSGTTDSIAAFIATGADRVGDAVTSLGSTLVVKLVSNKSIYSPAHGVYSHRLGKHWLVGGASNSGARVLQQFFNQQQLDAMTSHLNVEQPTGLDYYPLLEPGERFPEADVNKQPKLSPRPDDDTVFFQAILEGIARIEAEAYQKLLELGAPMVQRVFSVGGGSNNPAWTQIRKNHLKLDMIAPAHSEAAFGAALLALSAFEKN